jgi:hypothetical protein
LLRQLQPRVRHVQRRLELWPIREAKAIVASPALELGLCHRQSIGHLNDLERVGVAANDERDPGAVVVRLLDRWIS